MAHAMTLKYPEEMATETMSSTPNKGEKEEAEMSEDEIISDSDKEKEISIEETLDSYERICIKAERNTTPEKPKTPLIDLSMDDEDEEEKEKVDSIINNLNDTLSSRRDQRQNNSQEEEN